VEGRRVIDRRDLVQIEHALDSLEVLHDVEADKLDGIHVRDCLCAEAASWRQARKVTVAWRQQLGLKVRLLDQV
jgi:hypothetical protein